MLDIVYLRVLWVIVSELHQQRSGGSYIRAVRQTYQIRSVHQFLDLASDKRI
jgi:hypothetical protein